MSQPSGRITKRAVWDWLREHGPASKADIARALRPSAYCSECDREHADATAKQEVSAAVRELSRSGHVSNTKRWMLVANDTDSLKPPCSPFGAGAGETVSGDPPADEPGGGAHE